MGSDVYHTRVWRSVRRMVLERDRFRCQLGLPGCLGVASAVDHVVELQDGGDPYDLGNLQAACRPCNTSKRNKRVAEKARGSVRAW